MDSSIDTFKSADFDKSDEQRRTKTRDTSNVFESINIEDEFEDEEYRKKTRKRLIIISISSIILALLIVGAILGVLVPLHKNDTFSSLTERDKDSIKKICNSTLYKDSCYSSIYSLKMSKNENPGPGPDPDSPEDIFMLSLQVTFNELVSLKSSFSMKNDEIDSITRNALNSCKHLIQDAVDHVNMSISSWQNENVDKFTTYYVVSDMRTWLSTSITDQQTCLDGLTEFKNIPSFVRDEIRSHMQNGTEFTSNSLAIISNMFDFEGIEFPFDRKLIPLDEKRLFTRPNVTVARDGTGDYRSINEAVNVVPKRSKERFVIYVKEGVYEEQVVVDSECWNLMIYGDGMNKTIVSGRLNLAEGVATFNSATFIAEGRGFIARDMGFRNTAGPEKLQAVALRSSSDRSIFHRCTFDAYQDTLYTHTNRQFYRDCLITGTIDFIFGNSASIFQNCTIQPRQPGPGQFDIVTAQSKSDPNQNTGFSIQDSVISSSFGDLTAKTFLGRPWNNYSTTIFMETDIEGIIDPSGWSTWEPDVEAPDTIFYAEYKNRGPGSRVDERVMWAGYRPNITQGEAEKFCVEPFIQGSKWLIEANVDYDPHL